MSQLWRRTTDNGRRNVKIELFWNRIRNTKRANDLWMGQSGGLKLYPCSSEAFTDHFVRGTILFSTFDHFPSNSLIMFYYIPSYSVSGCVSRPTWLESQLIRKPRPRLLLRTSTNCRWQLYKDCLCITSGRRGRVQHIYAEDGRQSIIILIKNDIAVISPALKQALWNLFFGPYLVNLSKIAKSPF